MSFVTLKHLVFLATSTALLISNMSAPVVLARPVSVDADKLKLDEVSPPSTGVTAVERELVRVREDDANDNNVSTPRSRGVAMDFAGASSEDNITVDAAGVSSGSIQLGSTPRRSLKGDSDSESLQSTPGSTPRRRGSEDSESMESTPRRKVDEDLESMESTPRRQDVEGSTP
ncbi:hypothetical protein K435DRAFT_784811 [Dendrothele bispora CBS 962.96]|uniref:RxLR effector protein n=1 Tax=Dendrothele bispora (strain CBS 962.96) TaxID=1314807 RepID=A0A4S8L0L1_DENBC|nr:hypothetical protein K435DRAFT_784811 [Dendrothele bispora CBS 962.96]